MFALSEEQIAAGGRRDAMYEDLKWVSQEAEWFLGGILEGLADGRAFIFSSPIASRWVLIADFTLNNSGTHGKFPFCNHQLI